MLGGHMDNPEVALTLTDSATPSMRCEPTIKRGAVVTAGCG